MNEDNLLKLLLHSIERLRSGDQVEENKLELKREWPKFNVEGNEKKQLVRSEFLKDLVALANTPGPEGYLVYGIDQKTGEIFNAQFKESGLKDQVELRQMVVKFVDLPIDFELKEVQIPNGDESKTVSILVVPPSMNKPHIISEHVTSKNKQENYIPIRKMSGVSPATRSDIEFMYYDRKNIEPEYAVELIAHDTLFSINKSDNQIKIEFQLIFQNYGRKPTAIVDSTLIVYPKPEAGLLQPLNFKLQSYGEYASREPYSFLRLRALRILANHIETLMVNYTGTGTNDTLGNLRNAGELTFSVTAIDISGKEYRSKHFSGKAV